MRFSDFLLVSDPADLDFIVGYSGEQNIRIDVSDFFTDNISGTGNPGYIAFFTSNQTIGNSQLFQDGSNIVIGGVNAMGYRLAVGGSLYALGGTTIESVVPGTDTFRTIGEEGDSFIIPNDEDESIWTSRRIIHAPAVLTTESATLGQLNTAISDLEGDIELLLDLKVDKTSVGAANGVASLDSGGKVPLSQIPDSIIGQVEYMGTWNAFTNTPTLNPLVPEEKGHYYVVSVAGVFGGVDYQIGDWIISNGIEWQKVDNTDAVTSVFGRIGAILALEADYQSFYPRLSQAYDNPTWINTLAFSKITGVPPFLLENQTITLSGDVTGSGKTSISTSISDNAVTDSKLRNSVGTSVIGRASSITGDPGDIQATTDGHVLQRSGGSLLFGLISSDSIGSIDWSKIINTPTTLSGYGITNAYTKTESDNKFVPYTGANANVNLGSNNITSNAFVKVGGTSAQFLKADGSVDTSQYVPTTRSINAGTGLTGGGNLSSDVTLSFDTTWGDTRYAYRTRQLTINGVTYDLSADRTWSVGTVNTLTTIGTSGPATLVGNTLNIPNYTTDLSGYVTLATDQTITGLKTIVRSGDVLNFKIGTDTLYGLKLFYSQNELSPNGEATWSFVNTFNRDGIGYDVTPISFFRGVLVTGERLVTASINTNLLNYYSNNPSGRYPVYAYNTGVQQFSDRILVGFNTGVVNEATGLIANLPTGVVANFNGRVIGSNAVNSNEFVTLSQLPSLTGYVPYTGATQDLNLGTYGLISDFVRFNPSSSNIPSAEGVMSWDNTDGTVRLSVKGNTYSVPIGQSVISRVRNNTGGNLLRTNYQVVKISGAQGQRLAVTLAQANNDANSASTLGLVCENISNNQEGFIVNIGQVTSINTTGNLQGETWNDGDVLYLSPTIPGAITNIKPLAPQHTVILGYVEYAHANQGKIYVKIDNGYELEELHDVSAEPFINNGVLYRDTTLNLWKSATISTILGYTPAPQGNYITSLTGEATASGPGAASVTLSNSAVTGKVLTGLNVTGNAIVSTDSILTAFGKLQNQVNQLVGGLMYEGTWNAATNTPTITSSVGTDGTFYIVSVAGTTNINGINDWEVGDWIVFHDTSWQKVDNSDSVSSVFGRVGNIVANQSDYSAFYPLIADIKNGVLTVQGTGVLSGSGTFSANQATNNTITLTHAAVSRTDTTSSQTPSFGGSFTVVDGVTSSAEGHITAINTKTVTVPSTVASAVQTGLLSNTNWTTFNNKQDALTLTTTGSSGAATLVGATLNVPNYTLSGLGGVPTSRTITINGTAFDLSANRTWSVGTVTSVAALTLGTSGTDLSSTVSGGTTTPVITLNVPTASATNRGALSSSDWTTFNSKQNAITLTTTGTSGAATLVGSTLNIPQYQAAGTYVNGVTATSPLFSSGGTTPNITIQQSSTSASGFLSSTDWNTFNSKANANGSNASGTWGISISGNAASVSSITGNTGLMINRLAPTNYIDGLTSSNFRSTLFGTTSFGYAIATSRWNNVPTPLSGMNMYGTMMAWSGEDTHGFLAIDYASPIVRIGGGSNNNINWGAWVLHSSNFNSYAPTLTGGGASGTWGINITGSAASAGSVDFNNLTNKSGGTGTYQTSGDFRAPIFYDSNNTGLYLDLNSTSRILNLELRNNGSFDVYETNNTSFVHVDARAEGAHAAAYKYTYSTSTGTYGAYREYWWDGDSYQNIVQSGDRFTFSAPITAASDMRSPIFYDSNDTGYFGDFNGISSLWGIAIRGDNGSTSTTNQIFFWGGGNTTTSAIGFKNNGGNFPNPTGSGDGYNTYLTMDTPGRGWVFREGVGGTNFNAAYTSGWILNNGLWQANASMRAPIFYDSNNTAYYVNPAGASYVLGEFAVQQSSISGIRLISNSGTQSLWVRAGYDTDGSATPVSSPTNIQFQSSGNSGGTFTFVTGNTRALTIVSDYAEGSGSLRAPIFYDSNNTGFYFDGASTTNINALSGNGKEVMLTSDSYLRINQSNTFTGGTWFGSTLIRQDGFYAGSNGGTTTSRVAIQSGSFNGTNVIDINGSNGIITVSGDMRAPLFYDSNDTSYFVDPNSTSNMRVLKLSGGVTGSVFSELMIQRTQSGAATTVGTGANLELFNVGSGGRSWLLQNSNVVFKFFYFDGSAWQDRFRVLDNGGLANVQANNVNLSDQRLKTDIIPVSSYWDIFKNINIVKFKYKDQTNLKHHIGLLAQELESIAPEFISNSHWDEDEGIKTVYTSDLHHATIAVLKEALLRIEQLENKLL